jgi:pimeloyl-ACP methyl ester carboxylesterase/GNAT superfamily N-acetyltransferase
VSSVYDDDFRSLLVSDVRKAGGPVVRQEFDIKSVPPAERDPLLLVWRAAVEATHHFLTADDISFFGEVVARHLPVASDVRAAYDQHGRPVGFIAHDRGEIQMLFVEPDLHGRGVGSQLLDCVSREYEELRVDVNEQNLSGRRFYRTKGFTQSGRSALDPSGRPFPLLHLNRRGGYPGHRGTGLVTLRDGRELAYAEYGPASGRPIVFLPGAGCGRLMWFGDELLDERDIRLISIDRPGLGMSSPDPNKSLASVAADVAHLIDKLTGHPVPLVANSQGAPFGLAVGLTGAATGVLLASPIDDMAHPRVRPLLADDYRGLIDEVAADPGRVLARLSTLTPEELADMVLRDYPPSDTPTYGHPAFRVRFLAALSDGLRSGGDGYARDTLLAMTAWPDELFAATVPVTLLMGTDDQAHSPDRGTTLAERLGATRTAVDGVGGSLLWARPELVLDQALAMLSQA